MRTLIFGRMVVQKEKINQRSLIFLSYGRLQMKNINQWRLYFLIDWSCTNVRDKSMWTLIFGRMVVH